MNLLTKITQDDRYLTVFTYPSGRVDVMSWRTKPEDEFVKLLAGFGTQVEIISINEN